MSTHQQPRAIETTAPQSRAWLEVRDDDGSVWTVPLSGKHVVIGRSPELPIRLNSHSVSRYHAEMFRDPFDRWWVRDLGSRNGTLINGRPIQESVLRSGDVFEMGRFSLRVHIAETEPEVAEDAAPSADESDVPITEHDEHTQISTLPAEEAAKIDIMHLSTLTEFGGRLSQTEEQRERLRLLCRLMVRNDFHGRAAVVLRVLKDQPNHPPLVRCQPQSVPGEGDGLPYVSRRLLTAVMRSEAPVLASTGMDDTGTFNMNGEGDLSGDSLAAMACPISNDAKHIDLLYVTFPDRYGTPEWLALVSLAAQQYQQAEALLVNRRQAQEHAAIEQDLARASHIQATLVPDDPVIKGVDVSIGFEPCRWVGGDYADALLAPDGKVVLVVADVSGKGLPAALVTSSLHTMVHMSQRANMDLPTMVTSLNEHLCEYLDDCSFVTMVAISLDPKTGKLECINAGHPPPVIIRPDGYTRYLQHNKNLPLGVEKLPFSCDTDELDPGHLLAMFTDGLTEMNDAQGEMLGLERLTQNIQAVYTPLADRPTDVIRGAIKRQLDRILNDRVPLDDRTFLIARRQS
ncbi:MAG: SpoIIE family protein phosphatase [Phycisphaera sp.]|nr:SpoIIE family protein phosphatase [Phycisphaera sp.]